MQRGAPVLVLLSCCLASACGSGGDLGGGMADRDAEAADGAMGLDAGPGGDAGTPAPEPVDRRPCDVGTCWETEIRPARCSYAVVAEDFSTGRYDVHEYATTLYADAVDTLTLTRTGGTWQPVLIVVESGGEVLYDGSVGRTRAGLTVTSVADGTTGAEATVQFETDHDLEVSVFVTGWSVVDSGFSAFLPADATYELTHGVECEAGPDGFVAPEGALTGERPVDAGSFTVDVGDGSTWGTPVRVDARTSEHIGFRLDFTPTDAAVELELLTWDGAAATSLGVTSGGPGLRVIAAYDPFGARTFWVRARGSIATGDLEVTRTPIEEGPRCVTDCGLLLELPVAIDPVRQGFDNRGPGFDYREQFGRKELLMAIFHAGTRVADAGYGPFTLIDLSKWDGSQPAGHETHGDGFHADISLLTASGDATWSNPGADFGDEPMAYLIGGLFESGPFATGNPPQIILDTGFQDDVRAGADALLARGEITPEIRTMFDADQGLIYHYMGHDDHIHVRVDR